jgi:cytidylate kinase
MKIDLKEYMEERDRLRELKRRPGPVVTLSRQYGCEANKVAIKLLARIAEINHESVVKSSWRYINKEALEEAAEELGLPVHKIDDRFTSEHNTVNDLFASFGHHYMISDKRISETLTEILNTYIQRGKVIIIGRGGANLTQELNNAVNISLYAPIEHRAKVISKSKEISEEDAKLLIEEVDKNRLRWKENFMRNKFHLGVYDATLNTARLSMDEIIEIILTLMRERGILEKPN